MFKPKMYPKIKMPLTFELLQIFCPTEVTNKPEIQKQKQVRVEDTAMINLYTADPHTHRFYICKIIHSLKFICTPKSVLTVLLSSFADMYSGHGKKFKSPNVHVPS